MHPFTSFLRLKEKQISAARRLDGILMKKCVYHADKIFMRLIKSEQFTSGDYEVNLERQKGPFLVPYTQLRS
jgi:hypothetical protein